MKLKFKKMLAVALAACLLTAIPFSGFAAETKEIAVGDGTFTVKDSNGNVLESATANEGDKITAADKSVYFYVKANGNKIEESYGATKVEAFKEADESSEKSGEFYYNSFTVPSAPVGHKDGAKITVSKAEDFYKAEDSFKNGNVVNLEYEPISYKIVFDLNGTNNEINEIDAKYGSEIKLPTVTKEGFILKSWNTSANGNGTEYAPGSSVKNLTDKDGDEVKLYAIWIEESKKEEESEESEAKKYIIEFYLNESDSYLFPKEYSEGDKIILPEDPKKVGFTFAGWILGEENGVAIPLPETMPAENIKAYASWKINEVKVNYIVDGETYSSKSATYGSDIALTVPADPVKEGYVFAGWFDEKDENVHSYSTVPASDITFTAKWLKNGNVVYLVDKKTYEAYEVTEGEKIPVPESPKKFGYKFKGWNPSVPEIMGNEDLTFNAEWEVDKDFVTVIIGGTVIAGGIIAGIASAGAAAITGLSIIGGIIALIGVASNINKTYTVTYKVDGKVYQTYKVTPGSKIPVPSNPQKTGCKFEGWSPDIPETMPKQNLTFEAKWTEINSDKVEIPSTGSGVAGIIALASLAISAATALIFIKKKKK